MKMSQTSDTLRRTYSVIEQCLKRERETHLLVILLRRAREKQMTDVEQNRQPNIFIAKRMEAVSTYKSLHLTCICYISLEVI